MRLVFLDHDVLGGINEAPMKFVGEVAEVQKLRSAASADRGRSD